MLTLLLGTALLWGIINMRSFLWTGPPGTTGYMGERIYLAILSSWISVSVTVMRAFMLNDFGQTVTLIFLAPKSANISSTMTRTSLQ